MCQRAMPWQLFSILRQISLGEHLGHRLRSCSAIQSMISSMKIKLDTQLVNFVASYSEIISSVLCYVIIFFILHLRFVFFEHAKRMIDAWSLAKCTSEVASSSQSLKPTDYDDNLRIWLVDGMIGWRHDWLTVWLLDGMIRWWHDCLTACAPGLIDERSDQRCEIQITILQMNYIYIKRYIYK